MKFTIFPVKIGKKTSSRYDIIVVAQLCVKKSTRWEPSAFSCEFYFQMIDMFGMPLEFHRV